MNLDEAVGGLARARADIDSWDHDFTPAPYERYDDARDALATVPVEQRAGVVALLASPEAAVRREAANACAHWRVASAHDALVAALADPVADVREAVAKALIAVARETALGTLANVGARVSKSVLSDAIEAAMEAMGTAVLPLVERVDYAPDPTLGDRDVWWKLYQQDPQAAGEVLARRVASARFDWVNGAEGLVRAHGGGAWVRPAFMKLVNHGDFAIARVAAQVLRSFGDEHGIDPLLASARQATHPWQRQAALRSVLELGAKTQTPVLARVRPLLGNDEATQGQLMLALAGFANTTSEPPGLVEELVRAGVRHDSEKVAASAIRAARALRLEALAADVTATLAHRAWYTNDLVEARDAYFAWAPEASVAAQGQALERGLAAHDAQARALATNVTHVLARTPAGQAHVPLLRRALAADDQELRRAAAQTLAAFGVRDAADELLAHARVGTPAEASSMLDALARLGDARVVDVALTRAADVLAGAPIPNAAEPAWLCSSAVRALGCFTGDARAFEALGRSLRHVELRMRRDAATALGKALDVRAVPLLQPLLMDPEKQVRSAAQSALTALGRNP